MTDERVSQVSQLARALPAEYFPVDRNWMPSPPEAAWILGSGGSSIVLPSLYRGRLRRAVKIFLPRPDLAAQLDMQSFIDSYDNELIQQAALSHQNISKITDFASISHEGRTYPFIATEFIDGVTLDSYASDTSVSGEQVMAALKGALRGMSYLHSNNVMHCDIKQSNILVTGTNEPTAVIVDLGSSKHFPVDENTEDELLYLYTTPRYVPSRLDLIVANWTNNRIPRRELRKQFPYHDLHAFGIILEDLLKDSKVGPKLRQAVGSGNADALNAIRNRLRNPRPGGAYLQSADEIASGLDRASKYSLSVLGVPELSLAAERGPVLPGSVSRLHSTGRVDRIMSHPIFQRFHNLPQLDLLPWTLPGATQTRFVHAARAYSNMRNAIGHLLNDWEVRLAITVEDIEASLFASLLNQMGHYHFLHMFEDFIDSRDVEPLIDRSQIQSDEELLDDMFGRRSSPASKFLSEIRDERGRRLPDIVDSLSLNWSEMRRQQRRPASPLHGMLAALLSGPLDIEKFAYLRDDSQSAGIQFGRGLDPHPVFESLVLPREADWSREGGAAKIAMGITERAMSHLEYGVLTRYWNIQTVYWNRTNRAVQSMLKYQIASLISAELLDFNEYLISTLHLGSDGALRWLNDRFQWAQDDGAIDGESVNPMADLLESRRVIYRRLLTISGQSVVAGRDPDHRIFARIRSQSPLRDNAVCEIVRGALTGLDRSLHIRQGEILLDIPRVSRDTSDAKILVYTDDGPEYMGDLFKISPNLQQHQSSFDQYVKRMRIFVHPRIYDSLHRAGSIRKAYDAVLEALRDTYARGG